MFTRKIFQKIFWCGPFQKSLIYCSSASLLCFVFFGHKAGGILVPWPGIELVSAALEGKVSTTGLPGKYQEILKWT